MSAKPLFVSFAFAHSGMSTFVFVCAHAGWVYLWTAQTEMTTLVNMSSGEKERAAKAKLKPAPAPRHPSTRRRGKAKRGTLLYDCFP